MAPRAGGLRFTRDARMFKNLLRSSLAARPERMPTDTTFSLLDRSDRIVATGGNGDRFALDNRAPGALSDIVLGHSLFASIEGEEVRSLLQALIGSIRTTGRPARKM